MHLEWSSRTGGCWLMSLNVAQRVCSGNALFYQPEKSKLRREEKPSDQKEFLLPSGLWNQDYAWACFLLALQLLLWRSACSWEQDGTKKWAPRYTFKDSLHQTVQKVVMSGISKISFSSGLLVAFLCSTQLLIYVEISQMTAFHSVKLVKV